jgi:hypothetical protein
VQTYACDPNLLSISVETSLRGRLRIQQSAALSANEISVSVIAPGVPSTTIARLCASFEASSGSLRVSAEAVSAVLDAPEQPARRTTAPVRSPRSPCCPLPLPGSRCSPAPLPRCFSPPPPSPRRIPPRCW